MIPYRIEKTYKEHKRKTENRITSRDIWTGLKNKRISFQIKNFI